MSESQARVDIMMKVILAEEEKVQARGRTNQLPTSPSTPVRRRRSTYGDAMRVASSLPNKTQGVPALALEHSWWIARCARTYIHVYISLEGPLAISRAFEFGLVSWLRNNWADAIAYSSR